MTWSFSRCSTFETCAYEFYLNYLLTDNQGLPLYYNEQNFYASFGKFCHEILEKVYKNELLEKEATEYYVVNFEKNVILADNDSLRQKYYVLGLRYFDTLNKELFREYEIIGVEKKCTFEIKGKPFVGYIDLLLKKRENGNIVIVDHKSAEYPIGKKGKVKKNKKKFYDDYKTQLYLYSQAIKNEFGVFPKELWWNYFKENKWLKLPFKEKEFENSVKWADMTISSIYKEKEFLPSFDYFYCNQLCGFRHSCEYMLMGAD